MKTQHTPAPWSINGDNQTLIGGSDGRQMLAQTLHGHIVTEWARPLTEAQANARLIAAAPELLEALDDCITNENCTAIVTCDVAYMIRRFKAINAICRAAIAKATE